jgi:hypothetical protein
MEGRLFLDVVVRPSSSCLPTKIRSWTSKDEMEGRLLLDAVVRLSSSCLPTKIRRWKSKNQMKGRPLLAVVIGEGTAVLKLLADENKELDVEGSDGG